MTARDKLDEFAELRGWDKNKLIGWSEASDFAEWHTLSVVEKAVRDEKKANMNALADLIGNSILTRIKQATFDKHNN